MTTPSLSVEAALALGKLALAFGRTNRATFHEDGQRPETDSDHAIMLGLVALTMCPAELDAGLVARFVLVHDLIEAYAGDTNTAFPTPMTRAAKAAREAKALEQLNVEFAEIAPWLVEMIAQYEEQAAPEARFVRYLDKAMPKITHILNGCSAIKAWGRTLADVAASHDRQLARLDAHYPEWNHTPVQELMIGLMQRAEQAYEDQGATPPAGPSYRQRQIQQAWAGYGGERAWRNFKPPYDAVDYTDGELPPGWVWKDGQHSHSSAVPKWVNDAVEVFAEDECLLNDPTAPKVGSEWLARFGEERPHREHALTMYDGGDWIAYLFAHGRIYAGGPEGEQILLLPDPACKLRHPQGSERGTCACKGPPDCPFGTLDVLDSDYQRVR